MKLISWNVNGYRAVLNKGFDDFFKKEMPDILCIQEAKVNSDQINIDDYGYNFYLNSAIKKGYSGTAVWSKQKPISVDYAKIGAKEMDDEGRIITLEYDKFYLVNCYTPNSKRELERLNDRMVWEDLFRKYLKKLENTKPVIVCGDLNVAHKEIDLKNPKTNHHNAGFTDEERNKMTELLESGFIDTYRYFYKDKVDCYTWWSYMGGARSKNIGWRIDYFIVSLGLKNNLKDAKIHSNVLGSDHCPIELDIEV